MKKCNCIKEMVEFFNCKKNIKNIYSAEMVLEGLKELEELIELDDIKNDIVATLKYILLERIRKSKFLQNHAFHTVIYGNSGMGKSTLAKILAKIYIGIKEKDSEKDQERGVNNYDPTVGIKESLQNALQHSENIKEIIKEKIYPKYKVDFKLNDIIFSIENALFNLNEQIEHEKKQKSQNDQPKIIFAKREDLVDNIIGGTAIKTSKILENAKGGVLIIDEAYSLCYSDSHQDYGQESLTCIIDFMDKNPNDIIVIFCGYKQKLKETIFKVQPGLERRCQWFFEIKNYSANGLYKIFKQKLEYDGWKIDSNIKTTIIKSITMNKNTFFKYNGGSIEKLVTQCKFAYSDKNFSSKNIDSIINNETFLQATKKMQTHQLEDISEDKFNSELMYS